MKYEDKLQSVAGFCEHAACQPDSGAVLAEAAALAKKVFEARSAAILLLDDNTRQLCLRASAGLPPALASTCRKTLGTLALAEVLLAGRPLLIDRVDPASDEAHEFSLDQVPVSLACVRLSCDNRPCGCFVCESGEEGQFDRDDVALLRMMASACAVAADRDALQRISRKLIMTDPLTNIYSYGYFHRRLNEETERSRRLSQPVSLLLVDLDRLKEFRQVNGLPTTDRALREIVERITRNVRNIDVTGRYGADQFILYLPATPRDKAIIAAERLRAMIE